MSTPDTYLIKEKEPEFPCWMYIHDGTWQFFTRWKMPFHGPAHYGWKYWCHSDTCPTHDPRTPQPPALANHVQPEGQPTAIAPYLAQPAEKNVNLSRTVSNVFDALFENYVSDENDDGNYTLKLNAAATVKFFKQGREWMLSDLAQPSLPAGPSREVTDAELLEWVGNDPDRLDAAYQFFMSSSKSLREAIQSASASAAKEGEKS